MLDTNTNKVTWVAIATGVIAMLGVASMTLFPEAMDTGKNSLMQAVIYQSATPHDLKGNNSLTLTKARNFEPTWGVLRASLNYGPETIETKPGAWTLMELNFKTDKDVGIATFNINNYIKGTSGWTGSDDNDNKSDRKIEWYNDKGELIGTGDWLRGTKIKAGKPYKVVVRYHNTSDKTIEQRNGANQASELGFRTEGMAIPDDWTVHVDIWNYRVF